MIQNIVIALGLGIVAGIIDVIPMILQKLDKNANLSAFFHWIALGLIIPFVNWGIAPWLKGLLIAELAAIPMLFLILPKDKKALFPILFFSAVLGMGIAILGAKFIV